MALEQNKKDFMIACGTHMIFGDDVEKTKQEILAMIPESALSEYEDEWAAANANLATYLAGVEGNSAVPTPGGTQTQVPHTSQPTALSSEQQRAVIQNVQATQASQLEVSARSEILRVVIDKPAPASYLDPKMEVVLPKNLLSKLQKYAPSDEVNHVDPNDKESVDAYNKLLKAIEEGVPVMLHISDKLSSPIGVELSSPASGEGKAGNTTKMITKKHLTGFLSKEAFAHVPTGASGLGAKLNIQVPRNSKKDKAKATGEPVLGTPVAKITGVAEAIKDPAKHVIISEQDGNRTKDGSVSTELGFKIKTDKTKTVNNRKVPVYRLVRLRTTVRVPIWKRVNDELIKEFGTGNKDAAVVTSPVTPEETDKYTKLVADAQMSFLRMPGAQSAYGVTDLVNNIANMAAGGGQQAADATEL